MRAEPYVGFSAFYVRFQNPVHRNSWKDHACDVNGLSAVDLHAGRCLGSGPLPHKGYIDSDRPQNVPTIPNGALLESLANPRPSTASFTRQQMPPLLSAQERADRETTEETLLKLLEESFLGHYVVVTWDPCCSAVSGFARWSGLHNRNPKQSHRE